MRLAKVFARWLAAAGIFAVAALAAGAAAADEVPPLDGSLEVASGVEGGGQGHAAGVRRARTSVRIGGELALNDTPGPSVAAALVMEIEPRASVGADLRYVHLLGDRFAVYIGGVGVLAPATLLGATAGAELRLPVHKRVSLVVGTTLQGFFVGSDLPDNNVIWQGLLHVGIHLHLR